jgi:hypothetical protein
MEGIEEVTEEVTEGRDSRRNGGKETKEKKRGTGPRGPE